MNAIKRLAKASLKSNLDLTLSRPNSLSHHDMLAYKETSFEMPRFKRLPENANARMHTGTR